MEIKKIFSAQSPAAVKRPGNRKTKAIIWLMILALLLAGVWLWLSNKDNGRKTSDSKTSPVAQTQGNILSKASNGGLVAGFDRGFVLDPQAKILDSVEAKSPKQGYKMLVTFYESSLSLEKLAADYKQLFNRTDWKLMTDSVLKDQANFFGANTVSGETLQVSVVFIPPQQKNLVKVEFLQKVNP